MLNRDCNTCHLGDFTTRYPVSLNASNGGTGFDPISCVGCHGRQGDLNNGQIGAGLRQHHTNAGAAFCGGCHSDNNTATFTPAGESAAPPYYFTPDAAHPDKPTDPCNANAGSIGQESVFGTIGLDNDGDLLYDGDDPDCQPCTSDADCDDGVFCNGAETCNLDTGQCESGTPVDCSDGIDCTVDSCDEVNDACVNDPDDTACPDDGLFCNGTEFCDPAADCSSTGDPCPAGTVCNEDTDMCDAVGCTSDAECDDGEFCNGAETCNLDTRKCEPGTPVDCSDGVDCTVDSCDEVNDVCVNEPDNGFCDDGEFCSGAEICDPVNDCQAGTAPCDPATEICNEDLDQCESIGGEPVEVRVRVAKSINPKNNGVTPVRFFARGMDLEIAEVECGRGEAEPERLIHRDANDDGYVDVLAKFRTRALDIQCGDTTIMCEGTLTDGTEFMGTSNMFKTVGGYCKDKDKDKDEGKDKGKDKGK